MKYRENENNHVVICGVIRGEFTFSHSVRGEKFYKAIIGCERLSGRVDEMPILVSERLADMRKNRDGRKAYLEGEMRSYNRWENERSRLYLNVFAKYFSECEEYGEFYNQIYLDGYICKPVNYRETPNGREIADIFLAVNRAYGKSDYIPCICWGRNARYADSLGVGDHIRIRGRIQSREYMKHISEEEYEQRTAYEASICSMEVISDDIEENG